MRFTALKATLAGLLLTLPFGACECGTTTQLNDAGPGITCGEGTILRQGKCVAGGGNPDEDAGPGIECGPGTVPNQAGTACIPDIDCEEGTVPNEDGTGCVTACEAPFVLEGDDCVCPAGLVQNPAGDDCDVDPALCAEGTIFDEATGQCSPAVAPPPSDDDLNPGEAPATFVLPDPEENKRTEIGGIIGPVDNGAGDLDVFEFDGDAGDRMLVQLVSFGAQAASFILVGLDDATGDYFRMALPLENRRAVRHVVLPMTGRYAFIVSDRANVLELVGIPGIPVGGDDHSYSLVIDALPPEAPTSIDADGASHTGVHDNIDAYHVSTSSAPTGAILNALLAANDSDPDFDTLQVLWFIDGEGNYVELQPDDTPAVSALLPQLGSGTVFYVDYQYRLGTAPTYNYELSVDAPTLYDGPVVGGAPIDGNTAGDTLTFFEVTLEEENVYRMRLRLPEASTIPNTDLALVDTALNVLARSRAVSVGGTDYEELLYHAGRDAGGTYYITVVDGEPQNPVEESNFNVRLSLEGAAIATSALLSLPDAATFSANLDDPSDLDDDAWSGPWALVRVDGIADLTITTSADVTYDSFRANDFNTLPGTAVDTGDASVYGRSFRGPPGFEVLVQARGGDQTDQFALNANLVESPFVFEEEPNDSAATATVLVPPPALPATAAPTPADAECTDLSTAPQITASGRYTADLPDLESNFIFTYDGCGGGAGGDFYYRIPQQAAGQQITVTTLSQGDNAGADTTLGLAQVGPECDSASAVCLEYDDQGGEGDHASLSYTFTGDEGDLMLLIDSWFDGPLEEGTLVFDVNISLPQPTTNGFMQEGDVDWWSLAVTEPGRLTVNVESGPFGGNPDMDLSIFHIDASTEMAGPVPSGAGLSTYVEEAGTYYAVVRYFDEAGDYQINWSLDPTAAPPVTCSNPTEVTGGGDYEGDTTNGQNNWVPQNDACFGFDPDNYSSPDNLYSYTLPAGATLRATLDSASGYDAALAILDGSCGGACLIGSDNTISGNEEVVYQNTSGAPQDLVLVVDGYVAAGSYELSVEIFGAVCSLGEERCAGDNLEVCNSDGTGFDLIECPAGCGTDDFEQTASCNQHCGEGTANPDARCDGATLQACSADETRYEDTACAVACSDITDDGGRVVDAVCSFGLCVLDEVVCADDGGGVFVESTCNDDASDFVRVSCAAGCDAEGTACAPVQANPTAYTAPAPTEGACDLTSAPVIDASGIYTVALTAPTNDFDTGFESCARDGADVYWTIPARTAGTSVTIETLDVGDNGVADTHLALLSGVDCAATSATCVDSNDDISFDSGNYLSRLTYEFDGSEGDLALLVDSWSGFDIGAGDLVVSVEFSDSPFTPVAPAICTPDAATCDTTSSTLTACNNNGTAEESVYCQLGCNDGGDACQVPLGESCERPEPLDLSTGTATLAFNLGTFEHDGEGSCAESSTGPEKVFSFTATATGTVDVDGSGADLVLYSYEAICGVEAAELACSDGFGTTEDMTFDVTEGVEYFVVVAVYYSSSADSDLDVTVTFTPDVP